MLGKVTAIYMVNQTGRPSAFSEDIADTICERLADGESLRAICAEEGMPSKSMVFRWLGQHEAFRDQYERARETQADAIFDEILDIADDGSNDWMERKTSDGSAGDVILNGEAIQRSRLRVDARKWMAGKLRPKKYGDKVAVEATGKDGAPLIPERNDRDAARAVALILAKGIANAAERNPTDT